MKHVFWGLVRAIYEYVYCVWRIFLFFALVPINLAHGVVLLAAGVGMCIFAPIGLLMVVFGNHEGWQGVRVGLELLAAAFIVTMIRQFLQGLAAEFRQGIKNGLDQIEPR